MKKEKLFNEARDFKNKNSGLASESLFHEFNFWEKIMAMDEYDQEISFKTIVKIFDTDCNLLEIESYIGEKKTLKPEQIEKCRKMIEQSRKDRGQEG